MIPKNNTFFKIAAYFMLVVFCVVQTAEVLHHHNDLSSTISFKTNPLQKHTAVKGICTLCTLLAQQLHQDRSKASEISFTTFPTYDFHFNPSVITPTFSGFKTHYANKGPPLMA